MNFLLSQAMDVIQANDLTIRKHIDESIQALIAAAEQTQDDYMNEFLSFSGVDGRKRGNRMPSVRSRKTQGGATLEIRWMRTSKTTDGKSIRKSYPKGAGHSYSVARITKGSPEWEIELISKTESLFAQIRRSYSHLSKLRKQCSILLQSID